jgi:hypothetical protein
VSNEELAMSNFDKSLYVKELYFEIGIAGTMSLPAA